MKILRISYDTWKLVATNNAWATYHKSKSSKAVWTWTGRKDVIFATLVRSSNHADWTAAFGGGSTLVVSEDDAVARIIGLSGTFIVPKSTDGTPLVGSQNLALGREPFLRTDDGSELMSVDGKASGAPVVLWNGSGASDTGADWTPSSEGAESAASKKNGTNGWDTSVTAINTKTVFDNGAMVDIASGYDALDFWMQPKAYPAGSKFRVRWVDASNAVVGNQVLVANYAVNMDPNVWQKISIPISDFGLTGNAQKLQFRYRKAAGQRFWFDDIELLSATGGGPYPFRISAPDSATRYHLSMATLLISAPEAGWKRGNFANIVSGLSRGLILRHRRKSDGTTLWKFAVKNNVQLFGQYHPQESFSFYDTPTELLVGFMIKPGRASVLITDDDVLEFIVRDDLSSITEMRAFCHYGVENVL